MILITICILLLTIFAIIENHKYKSDNVGRFMLAFLMCFILAFILIYTLATYYNNKVQVEAFKSVQITIDSQRINEISDLERATLTTQIIDNNAWLAKSKLWNKTIFGDIMPDEVESLKPIR